MKRTSIVIGLAMASGLMAQAPMSKVDAKPAAISDPQIKAQTSLTTEENEQLLLALSQAQGARITWLEHLMANVAGATDAQAADEANRRYSTMSSAAKLKHNADAACEWNFPSKQWACPPKADSEIKK